MFSSITSFFSRHRRLRALLCAALLLILLLAFLHPKGTKTFLILGMDNYGSLEETGRSDVMMLVQLDFSRTEITAVTFARDMFLKGPQGGDIKLNTIVRTYDEDTLINTLQSTFDLKIDGWFRVNFTTVIELVDALGGARIDLSAAEAYYINTNAGYYPDYPLSEGECLLCGGQALVYARCRKLDNDLGRGQRQNKLLSAMVQSTKHLTLSRLVGVFNAMKHAWRSSLSAPEQISLLGSALWLRGAHVQQIGMPFDGCWRYGNSNRGENGVIVNIEKNKLLLHEALGN